MHLAAKSGEDQIGISSLPSISEKAYSPKTFTANVAVSGDLGVANAQKLGLDGLGGSTYLTRYSNQVIDVYVNGEASMRLYPPSSAPSASVIYGPFTITGAALLLNTATLMG